MSKPKFDPNKPFEASKPAFNPSAPVEPVRQSGSFDIGEVARSLPATPAPAPTAAPMSFAQMLRGEAGRALEGLNRTSANAIQGLSLNTAHRWVPELFAAVDEGREMVGAASPRLFEDRVRDQRTAWSRHLDPAATAASAAPLMLVPGLNTFGGTLASNTLAALGAVDQRGGDVAASEDDGQEVGKAVAISMLPSMLKGGVAAAKGAARATSGWVRPTPEAARMLSEGVDLTLGQRNPSSALGRYEEVAISRASGGTLATMRDAAVDSARDALIRKAQPSLGAKTVPTGGTPVGDQLGQVRQAFSEAYEGALAGERLQPDQYLGAGKWRGLVTDESLVGSARTKGAFELAANSKGINASRDVRDRALEWLNNEATSLVPTKSGPNGGTVEARDIHALRTRLRDEIRALGDQGDDRATKQIYQRAEEFVTELLEGQLPKNKAETLRGADASYRNLLALETAAGRARAFRNDGRFTMADMLEAIRQKGSTPQVEGFARDADRVLSAKFPVNGALGNLADVLPVTKYVGPGVAQLANTAPWLRSHALGTVGPTRLLQDAQRSSVAVRSLYDLLREPAQSPLLAEDQR